MLIHENPKLIEKLYSVKVYKGGEKIVEYEKVNKKAFFCEVESVELNSNIIEMTKAMGGNV